VALELPANVKVLKTNKPRKNSIKPASTNAVAETERRTTGAPPSAKKAVL
jgi:hypothetical protein